MIDGIENQNVSSVSIFLPSEVKNYRTEYGLVTTEIRNSASTTLVDKNFSKSPKLNSCLMPASKIHNLLQLSITNIRNYTTSPPKYFEVMSINAHVDKLRIEIVDTAITVSHFNFLNFMYYLLLLIIVFYKIKTI